MGQRIGNGDIVTREGIRLTGPVRSIMDAVEAGTAPEQILSAVRQALDRGSATRSGLARAAKLRGGRIERLVREALETGRR